MNNLAFQVSVVALTCSLVLASLPASGAEDAFLRRGKSIFVDNVWTGASMNFSMAVHDGKQYAAYYDKDGWMTIGSRSPDSEEWQRMRLDNKTGWDSHNYVTIAFDSEGHIHVSGNMHCAKLRYYRTTRPGDVTSLVGVHGMTGEDEDRVTYPRFLNGPKGEFLFTYRDGGSGNGRNIVNVYDAKIKTWKRYFSKALFDGEGDTCVYYRGPERDSKGAYHLAWEWRDTPDCSTNHDISYAQSPGSLDHWQKSDGTPIELPLRIGNCEIIDPTPIKSGLLMISFSLDAADRPLVSYLKFDPKGRSQIYTMRLESAGWKRYQTTNWSDRYDAQGYGIPDHPIAFVSPRPWNEGALCQVFLNRCLALYQQIRFLDEKKLQQIGEPMRLYPPGFDTPTTGPAEEWHVKTTELNLEELRRHGSTWILRWDAMRPNRDKPREKTPPPSRLELVELALSD